MADEKHDLDRVEKLLRILSLQLQLRLHDRDLSSLFNWREWLKAGATVVAFLGVAISLYTSLSLNQRWIEEERAKRFENAINRLGGKDASGRLTGLSGLVEFINGDDPHYKTVAWHALVQAIATEEDPVVEGALLISIQRMPATQPMLDDALQTLATLDASLVVELVNPLLDISKPPAEALARSFRLSEMAKAINILLIRGAKASGFEGVYCVGCDFRKLSGDQISFSTAILDRATFEGATLPNADFSGTSLLGANFEHTNLRGAKLVGINTKPFLWYQSYGTHPKPTLNFTCADLSGARLEDSVIFGFEVNESGDVSTISTWGFTGTDLKGTKISSLYVYFTSAGGKPKAATNFDEDSEMIFVDGLGHKRWVGLDEIPGFGEVGNGDLQKWDDIGLTSIKNAVNTSAADFSPGLLGTIQKYRYLPSEAHQKEQAKECADEWKKHVPPTYEPNRLYEPQY